MIQVDNRVIKKQPKFWNHALFHPTDAIEDPWGKRILDRMARDGAIKTIRIYSMFEDIVYLGEDGEICYDFRLSDLRLDYLLEKGYDLLIAYAGMPDCIAKSTNLTMTAAKNSTRYKGKMWNSAPPKDYAVWEEVCYEYTKHLVERYGEDTVSKWHCHCHNEPDGGFWMRDLGRNDFVPKCDEYCTLYDAFVRGVRRASKGIRVGGPALAHHVGFLDRFLLHIKETGVEMNYIALHAYGASVKNLNDGSRRIATENLFEYRIDPYMEMIRKHGFEDTELIIDEWGASAQGFYNVEECPSLWFREHEVFSAFFVKMIYQLIESGINISRLMICLSGQHEMVTDFSGFRNFFTLNFIAKPIYNAHLMTSKMEELLVESRTDNENVFAVSTKNESGCYSTLLTYCSRYFEENLPSITEEISYAEDLKGKTVTVYCIDKTHTNPYRLFQRMNIENEPNEKQLKALKEEGKLKPIDSFVSDGSAVKLDLTPNCTYLVLIH
ncbi:MAG: hypothetical protein IKA76_05800 [Clostridia bacterium]|nr:hypothetical protein [Clostridia bacterium]